MGRITLSGLFCVLTLSVSAQSIDEINYILDSVEHSAHHRAFRYWEYKALPDSTKKKMINVLNGYLPPQMMARINNMSLGKLQHITQQAKRKCKKDMECVRIIKDSLIKATIEIDIDYSRNTKFSASFILALASWNVHEAKEILWKNRTKTNTFPEVETYMALARFGYTEALDSLLEWMSVDINCVDAQHNADDYVRKSLSDLWSLATYIKNKEFYLRMVDLFDIEKYGYGDISPDTDRYPTEHIVLSNISEYLYTYKNKNSVAHAEWNALQNKWENFMPSISDEGLSYINRLCERRVILDVNHETIQTIEQLCTDDMSNLQLSKLIDVIRQYCADDISVRDIHCYVKLKQFRQSGLKQQMKSEVRTWIDKYVTF